MSIVKENPWMHSKVLVTGATGFLGSNFLQKLQSWNPVSVDI